MLDLSVESGNALRRRRANFANLTVYKAAAFHADLFRNIAVEPLRTKVSAYRPR